MRVGSFVLVGIMLAIIPLVHISLAQQNSSQASAPIYQNNTTLKGNQAGLPVLEKISDKGHYRVQLKWDSTSVNPSGEFDMQVLFLNASSPHSNSTNFPQTESNYSGYSSRSNLVVSTIVDKPIAVDHYDVTIYDNSGHVLYQKTNVPGEASAGGVTVSLGNYTGSATISITNITAAQPLGSTSAASNSGSTTDSVKFTTSVVPEFPLVPIAFMTALSSALAIWRLKRGHLRF